MYNIKSKMMSANNEMKIMEVVKNFYETNNINPNEEIMVVPIYDVEEAELKGARLLLGIKYRKELGYLKKDKLIEEAKKSADQSNR